MRTRFPAALGLIIALLAAPATLRAQTAGPETPTASETAASEPTLETAPAPVVAQGLPARAAPPRTLRAHWHVFVAFAVVWVLLFGYALSIGRRFARLEGEVRRLEG